MRLLVDTTPLRVSPDFRRLWIGQAVSSLGLMITAAALPYQVFHQTGSSLAVGLLGLAQLGPLLVFSILGGALADSLDKRRLLLGVTATGLVCSSLLAANAALDHPQLWLLYVLGAVSSAVLATSYPALRSLLPLLVEEELRPAAFALQSTYGSFGMMAGPAVGGVLIGAFGLTSAYAVDVGTYFIAIAVFAGLAPAPPVPGASRASTTSSCRVCGSLRGHSVVMSIFGIDLLGDGVRHAPRCSRRSPSGSAAGRRCTGCCSSVAAGAFIASLLSGWTTRVRHQGRAVLWAVAAWGAAIAIAGLTRAPALVLAMLADRGRRRHDLGRLPRRHRGERHARRAARVA